MKLGFLPMEQYLHLLIDILYHGAGTIVRLFKNPCTGNYWTYMQHQLGVGFDFTVWNYLNNSLWRTLRMVRSIRRNFSAGDGTSFSFKQIRM